VQRVLTSIIALLMIAVVCGELTCFAEETGDECCQATSCPICSHSVSIVEPVIAPLPVLLDTGVVAATLMSPESPDLARLTPPPIA
jgi:hypothetical protein